MVVFDGFTGFTPIQNKVIQELMRVCGEVIVTVTMGEGENPYVPDGEQRLFHLSKKTVSDLCRLAKEADVPCANFLFSPCIVTVTILHLPFPVFSARYIPNQLNAISISVISCLISTSLPDALPVFSDESFSVS